MTSEELVFSSSELFEVTAFHQMDHQVILSVQSRQKECPCPLCKIPSRTRHSYYYRTIRELPAFDNMVFLKLKAKKWYCQNPDCIRKVFTERFEHYFTRYKRFSDRLREKLLNIALLVGGNAGEKLCRTLSISATSSTLIRLIHAQQIVVPSTATAIGIDDWAFKKGINYGTAIVDLDEHRVIDLLADREAQTVENWLKNRPEVTIVTRDRFSRYALGVTNGSPDAIQVADRWHLLKNMGDALQKLLERKRQQIIALQSSDAIERRENDQQQTPDQTQQVKNLSPRYQLLQRVKEMYAVGKGSKSIAKTLQISRNTVKKYIHLHEPPQKKGIRTTNLNSFNEYLQTRIEQDAEVSNVQLFREIKSMGYNGGKSILNNYLNRHGKQRKGSRLTKLPAVRWTAAKVKVLLCKKDEMLKEKDKELVEDICEKSADIH